MNDLPSDADDPYDRPSKTAQKKAMHELQTLGEALMTLPDTRIDAIGLPESLRDAVRTAQRTKTFEGKRRQVQYLGKLMRRADVEPIREAVTAFQLGHAKDALARWTAQHPGGDLQQLRNLVRSARKDAAALPDPAGLAPRQGRAYRELFQLLRAALNAANATEAAEAASAADESEAHD